MNRHAVRAFALAGLVVAAVVAWIAATGTSTVGTPPTPTGSSGIVPSPSASVTMSAQPSPGASPPPSAVAPAPPSAGPSPAPSLKLTFEDRFGGSRVKSVWGRHWPGFGSTDWTRSKSKVEDGVLKITATNVGQRWISDLLDTVDTFEQRYGVFEARIRYPAGTGLWPAFWLAQPQNPKREMAEVDIVEACGGPPGSNGGNDITVMNIYVHRTDGSHALAARKLPAPDAAGVWHDYRLEWRPDRMVFTRDGIEMARLSDPAEIPDMKMAVVLDLAGGGGFCGPPDGSTPRNATMEVDWVRVWR